MRDNLLVEALAAFNGLAVFAMLNPPDYGAVFGILFRLMVGHAFFLLSWILAIAVLTLRDYYRHKEVTQ